MSIGNDKGDRDPVVKCGPSMTKQSFKDVADINNIIARYRKNGALDYVNRRAPAFADVSELGDFGSVVARVRAAQESFERLPAYIRSRFANDPANLIAFLSDASNIDEAVKLGLAKPKPKAEPGAVPAPAPSVDAGKPADKPNV